MGSNVRDVIYSNYVLDQNDRIIKIDKEFTRITGYTAKYIKTHEIYQADIIFPEDREEYFKLVHKNIADSDEAFIEHRIKCKDGTGIYVFCLGIKGENGTFNIRITNISETLCIHQNTNEVSKKYNQKFRDLVNQATTDGLTGLLRRDAFEYKVGNYLKNEVPISFLMIDVDNFKSINDTYGHEVGDRILKNVSSIFKECIDDDGIVSRLGGDEFAGVIVNIYNKKEIKKILDTIYDQIKKISIREDKNFCVTLSMGVKIVSNYHKAISFKEIYLASDEALYKSKNNGKNQYNFK